MHDPAAEFGGEPLVTRAICALLDSGRVDQVVVQAGAAPRTPIAPSDVNGHRVRIGAGDEWFVQACGQADLLLIHDPARALTPVEIIRSVVDTVASGSTSAAVPAQQVTDTIKLVGPDDVLHSTWDRQRLRSIQSPLCCRASLVAGLRRTPGLADLPQEGIRIVPGDPLGMRLDTRIDKLVAEALLQDPSKRGAC